MSGTDTCKWWHFVCTVVVWKAGPYKDPPGPHLRQALPHTPPLPLRPIQQEAPSDFQDYTLVAIVAVAAHLLKQPIGEDYGLRHLAELHHHDFHSLDQVFWHILTRLSYYRELHVRSQAMSADGAVSLTLWGGWLGWRKGRGARMPVGDCYKGLGLVRVRVVAHLSTECLRLPILRCVLIMGTGIALAPWLPSPCRPLTPVPPPLNHSGAHTGCCGGAQRPHPGRTRP